MSNLADYIKNRSNGFGTSSSSQGVNHEIEYVDFDTEPVTSSAGYSRPAGSNSSFHDGGFFSRRPDYDQPVTTIQGSDGRLTTGVIRSDGKIVPQDPYSGDVTTGVGPDGQLTTVSGSGSQQVIFAGAQPQLTPEQRQELFGKMDVGAQPQLTPEQRQELFGKFNPESGQSSSGLNIQKIKEQLQRGEITPVRNNQSGNSQSFSTSELPTAQSDLIRHNHFHMDVPSGNSQSFSTSELPTAQSDLIRHNHFHMDVPSGNSQSFSTSELPTAQSDLIRHNHFHMDVPVSSNKKIDFTGTPFEFKNNLK